LAEVTTRESGAEPSAADGQQRIRGGAPDALRF